MGAIIDFSTGAAFFRNLTDQYFVQLERETQGHLYLSRVEDMLSQPILEESQLQVPSSGTGPGQSRQKEGKTIVLQHHPRTRTSSLTMTSASTPDQLQLINYRREIKPPISHTRQILGSMQHSTTDFVSLPVRANEHDSNVSVGIRRPQERRMPSLDGTFGRGTTTPWSTGGGTEGHAQEGE